MRQSDATIQQIARALTRAHSSMPVEVVDGNRAPEIVGEPYYYTTPSGKTVVARPTAYGWPTAYHHSTQRVVVGRSWYRRHGYVRKMHDDNHAHAVYEWPRTRTEIHGITIHEAVQTDGSRVYTCRRDGCAPYYANSRSRYHDRVCRPTTPRDAAIEAVRAWREQARLASLRAERLAADLDVSLTEIYVTRDDSINAGNCGSETDAVARQARRLGLTERRNGVECIRADKLATLRNDSYARNAIERAK